MATKGIIGLNNLEWAKVRKRALLEQKLDDSLWERMTPQQKWWLQQLKLAFQSIEDNNYKHK